MHALELNLCVTTDSDFGESHLVFFCTYLLVGRIDLIPLPISTRVIDSLILNRIRLITVDTGLECNHRSLRNVQRVSIKLTGRNLEIRNIAASFGHISIVPHGDCAGTCREGSNARCCHQACWGRVNVRNFQWLAVVRGRFRSFAVFIC